MTNTHRDSVPPPTTSSHALHQRAKAVFGEVFELSADVRHATIERLCGSDLTLRAEVLALLRAADDHAASDLLDDSAFQAASKLGSFLATPDHGFASGCSLGKYTIRRLIGEGGMGMVYEATQESPQRAVALKVIRPGMLTEGAARRFRHEASLLARLQHPGIAAIYEAGRDPPGSNGIPFLAMELIQGVSLHEYVRKHPPSRQERLNLFLAICDAVTHAHQRGIIHQDLKPANILVESSGRVRVMDFGIARLIAHDPISTIHNVDTSAIAGTLAYMSPEQASGDPTQIDTRTDVYALGVILFELLSGIRPLLLEGLTLPQSLDAIRSREAARLAHLDSTLAGDLDVLCQCALNKDPSRRYQSVEALASDVRRHLQDLPILARADSWWYVSGRFVKRHRLAVATIACGVAGLFAFAGYAKVQERRQAEAAARAETATLKATQEEARAAQSAAVLATELRRSYVERGRLLAQNGNLTAAEELLWRYHLATPQATDTQWALRELYTRYRSLRAFGGHDVVMSAIALHPNGTTIAAPGTSNSIILTDGTSGSRLQTLTIQSRRAIEVEFMNDGRSILALLNDGTLIRWDTDPTGRYQQRWLTKPLSSATALCIIPDRDLVIAAGSGGLLQVITLSDGATTSSIPLVSTRARCQSLAFDKESGLLAVGCDGTASFVAPLPSLIDSAPGKRTSIGTPRVSMMSLAFAPHKREIWSGETDGNIRRWDPVTGELLGEISLQAGPVRHIEFSQSQALIASAWRSDLLELATLNHVPNFEGVFTRGFDAIFAPKLGGYLAAAADGAIRLWALPAQTPVLLHIAAPHSVPSLDELESLVQNPHMAAGGDGLLAHALPDGTASVSRHNVTWLSIPRSHAQLVCLSSDGSTAAFLDKTLNVAVYRYPDQTPFRTITLPASPETLAVSPFTLIAASNRGVYTFYDLTSDSPPVTGTNLPTPCLDLTISRDGLWAISTQRQFRVSLWNARTGARLLDVRPDNIIWHLAFSPDGKYIAAGTFSGGVEVYHTQSLSRLWSAEAHSRMTSSVAFTPSGSELISTSIDGSAKVWNATDGQPLAVLRDPSDVPGMAVRSAAFNEDDQTLHLMLNSDQVHSIPLHAADPVIQAHREHMTARIAALDARPITPPTAKPTTATAPTPPEASKSQTGGHAPGDSSVPTTR